MFLDFYQLKEQPFGVTPDPRYLYLGSSHREALASLFYGIESDRGFVALIAQPGLGKTTLAFQFLEKLQPTARTVFLFQTQCDPKELLRYLLNGLGVDAEGMQLVSMHNRLNQILTREMLAGRRFILAIDEAQNLSAETLEMIRLLSNFETSRDKMLQILLIGQPQLAEKLSEPKLEQLQQRISVFARLDPFGIEDTSSYIDHRLRVAGYKGAALFSDGALRMITEQSHGIPRRINALCFSALSLGCAMNRKQIDVETMKEVVEDRDLQTLQTPKTATQPAVSPVTNPIQPFSYSAKPRSRFLKGSVFALATLLTLVAIVLGTLSLFPGQIDRTRNATSFPWSPIRDAAASFRDLVKAKSAAVPPSLTPTIEAAGLDESLAVQPQPLNDDPGADTVIVQRGDTLRQIILRTIGQYDSHSIQQIRRLNPEIGNVDHLEAGQIIRLPRVPAPANFTTSSTERSATGKNSEQFPQ